MCMDRFECISISIYICASNNIQLKITHMIAINKFREYVRNNNNKDKIFIVDF